MCTIDKMGSSQSNLISHEQQFVIRTRAVVARNSSKSPSMDHDVRREIYTYLNSFIFKNQLNSDLDAYFEKATGRVLQIVVSTVVCSHYWNIVTIRGFIKVLKPNLLSKKYSVGAVRAGLRSIIPKASRGHKYPVRNFGSSLGLANDRLTLRFHSLTTTAKIIAKH